jgi:hypothetical protein
MNVGTVLFVSYYPKKAREVLPLSVFLLNVSDSSRVRYLPGFLG